MINLDCEGISEDFQKKGFYFRPKMHIGNHYLIEVNVRTLNSNCLVTIYEIGIPQRSCIELQIQNGEGIATSETEYLCEIDLWGKYYFPKFKTEQYQWYYNSNNENADEVMAMAEVMKFSIELGLKIGKIDLY